MSEENVFCQNESGHPLLALPANPVLGVFDQNPLGQQIVANRIGAGKVARLLRLRPLGHQSVDLRVAQRQIRRQLRRSLAEPPLRLRPGQRRPRQRGIAIFQHREHSVEEIEHAQNLSDVRRAQRSRIGGRIGRPHQLEDRGARLGGV
jgi:hypothetical protein